MVQELVVQRIAETSDMDYKQILPDKGDKASEEFAKDVAAMANSGGGVLVFGVAEHRGTGEAEKITPVGVNEHQQRRLRQLAATRVHPMVTNLQFVPLPDESDPSQGVLVMVVPASSDAPHTIGQQGRLGIPYRDGPETRWMNEAQLERAYRERFTRTDSHRNRLISAERQLRDRIDLDVSAWVTAVMIPQTPLPAVQPSLKRAEVSPLFEASIQRSSEVLPVVDVHRYTLLSELRNAALNPGVGLRRWVIEMLPQGEGLGNKTGWACVELCHDGTVTFAAACDPEKLFPYEGKHAVSTTMVESFVADVVALAETAVRQRSIQAPLLLRVDLIRGDEKPLVAVATRRFSGGLQAGEMRPVIGSRTLSNFIPIETELPVLVDVDSLKEIGRDLALDALHQFRVSEIRLFS